MPEGRSYSTAPANNGVVVVGGLGGGGGGYHDHTHCLLQMLLSDALHETYTIYRLKSYIHRALATRLPFNEKVNKY